MGVAFLEHLGGVCFFLCAKCNTFLSNCSNCFDKNFVGRTGRAFLFNKVVNVVPGPAQPRQMITGKFMICDVQCKKCSQRVGWRYEYSFESSQRWKEGMTILERNLMSKKSGQHWPTANQVA